MHLMPPSCQIDYAAGHLQIQPFACCSCNFYYTNDMVLRFRPHHNYKKPPSASKPERPSRLTSPPRNDAHRKQYLSGNSDSNLPPAEEPIFWHKQLIAQAFHQRAEGLQFWQATPLSSARHRYPPSSTGEQTPILQGLTPQNASLAWRLRY